MFWTVLLLGAVVQLAANADAINADGISYLDLSDQFAHGDWLAVRNGYWSPLYPAIIGAVQRLVGWQRARELLAVHVIGFAMAIGCAFAIERFVAALAASQHRAAARDGARPLDLDGPLGRILAYSLTLEVILKLAPTHYVTPDLLVAALTICSGTLLLRAHQGVLRVRGLVLLGGTLGAGYLAKSAMLPAGIFTILLLPLLLPRSRRWRGAAVAALGFTIVSAPLVFEQSAAQGHVTFGESGRLNYAWYVNDATRIPPLPPATANAVGAPLRLASIPKATFFPGETPGTYSFWFDPSRWSWDAHPQLDLAAQLRVLALNFLGYRLMLGVPLLLIASFYLLAFAGRSARLDVRGNWFLVVPAVAQLSMYWLVHAEGRYVAGSLLILLLALVGAVRSPRSDEWDGMRAYLAIALALVFIARLPYRETATNLAAVSWHRGTPSPNQAIASGLARRGVPEGARIAVVGPGYDCYWARLARMHVVAVVEGDDRWPPRHPVRVAPALPVLAGRGIEAVVGPRALIADRSAIDIDDTGYALFLP